MTFFDTRPTIILDRLFFDFIDPLLICHCKFCISISVEAVAGNGRTTSASSNGIYIDITPPIFDIQFYLDATKTDVNDLQPVTHQASNTTIKSYWNFIDEESEIKV